MNLKDSLRQSRLLGRRKDPLIRTPFTHVGGLVRAYDLGAEFCRHLRQLDPAGAIILARVYRNEPKPAYNPPLFFLAKPEEWALVREILEASDSPYLAQAHSPEEILLAGHLWARHPGLDAEELSRRHFAALLVE
ncbi:MAG: hypothetical protein FJ128_08140 [Deltaproteobacteria bacterium]|nr:hypothetical protein [Deltaproteobacteria bacterium]